MVYPSHKVSLWAFRNPWNVYVVSAPSQGCRYLIVSGQWCISFRLWPLTFDISVFAFFYISPCSHMSHAHVLCHCISKISICDPLSIMCTFCMNCPIYLSTIHPCFPWPWCYLYTTQRSSTLGSLSQIIHLTVRHVSAWDWNQTYKKRKILLCSSLTEFSPMWYWPVTCILKKMSSVKSVQFRELVRCETSSRMSPVATPYNLLDNNTC